MIKVKDDIYCIGITDWGLKNFHGHELSTHRGSSYNSYIIKDQKTVLVDTVWDPYKEDFLKTIEKEIGINNIDLIVINHIEPDHGGSLGYIMEKIPDVPIYCTKNGAEIIKKHFHKNWNFNIVKTGDQINIGKYDLIFVEMQMIHWPDSLLTYVKGAGTVLSSDAFGQHYATSEMFDDLVDNCELFQEAIKYYANILTPFSGLIAKKIEQIKSMNLDIQVIAPSHGVIWRKNPSAIIEKYEQWSNNYNEGFVAIVYDTMYQATRHMAESIGEGLREEGVYYKIFNNSLFDQSDLITELFKAKGMIIGSCTVNNGVMRSIAGLLDEIKGHKFKGKYGAAFGSYGWSGEAAKHISKFLQDSGINVVCDPIMFKYKPTDEEIKQCFEFGRDFARKIK